MLLKKIERSQAFLQQNLTLFSCPVCHTPLDKVTGFQLQCHKGHQFELNKKGSLHFLPHKIATDYNREMLLQRQEMIQSGLYAPLVERIGELLATQTVSRLLDVGCGEGSLLNQVTEAGVPGSKIGFDISKDGIALATEQSQRAFWCVADLTNLPFRAGSISHILNIFSPSHYGEFRRVLAPGGQVIKVVPGAGYLQELRALFYADNVEKQTYTNQKVVTKFATEMSLLSRERLTYEFAVPAQLFPSLLEMSPLQWGASVTTLAEARQKQVKNITIDLEILVGDH